MYISEKVTDKRKMNDYMMKKLRIACWNAFKQDDPDRLVSVLRNPLNLRLIHNPNAGNIDDNMRLLFDILELGLWRNSQGFGGNGDRRGLLSVAAGNVKGIPKEGAVHCLERLIQEFPDDFNDEEINRARTMALRRGRERAAQILSLL